MNIDEKLKKKIYFVIPAYNEGKVIKKVITTLNNDGYYNIILVDDGSTDNTSGAVKGFKGLIYLKHVINRGQGASLKTGIDYALLCNDCKYIVTFDSDGQHRISDLWKFVEVLEKGKVDIVLGSRFLDKNSVKIVPLKKRILLKGGILVTFLLSGKLYTDTHNGYRMMNRRAAEIINITMDGFEHASEILDEIARKKIPFREVPVFIDYSDYSKTKGQKMRNSIKIFLKMIFRR
jgi:polyprenyl-phospho-N-acetylgalactosaminyl synthase